MLLAIPQASLVRSCKAGIGAPKHNVASRTPKFLALRPAPRHVTYGSKVAEAEAETKAGKRLGTAEWSANCVPVRLLWAPGADHLVAMWVAAEKKAKEEEEDEDEFEGDDGLNPQQVCNLATKQGHWACQLLYKHINWDCGGAACSA